MAASTYLIFIVTNTLLEFSPFFKNHRSIFKQFLNFKAPFSCFSYGVFTFQFHCVLVGGFQKVKFVRK